MTSEPASTDQTTDPSPTMSESTSTPRAEYPDRTEAMTASCDGVKAEKTVAQSPGDVVKINLTLVSTRETPAEVRLIERIPAGVDSETVEFHPRFTPDAWRIEDDRTLVNEATLEPHVERTIVYGFRAEAADDIDGIDEVPSLTQLDREEHHDPQTADDQTGESSNDEDQTANAETDFEYAETRSGAATRKPPRADGQQSRNHTAEVSTGLEDNDETGEVASHAQTSAGDHSSVSDQSNEDSDNPDPFEKLEERMEAIESETMRAIESLDARLESVEVQTSRVNQRVAGVDDHVTSVEERVDAVDERLDESYSILGESLTKLRDELEAVRTDVDQVKSWRRSIQETLAEDNERTGKSGSD